MAKASADTAAAAEMTRRDEFEKLRSMQRKSEDTISQLKLELEKLRAAAMSETAAKAKETQKWEAEAAQAQDTISKLQKEF